MSSGEVPQKCGHSFLPWKAIMPVETNIEIDSPTARTEIPHFRPAPAPRGSQQAILNPPGWYSWGKRVMDVCLALVLLVLTAPLVILSAILIKLTSRGPVFYSQTRIGRAGKPFTIYKIRSMYHDCERHSGARWSQPGDPRVMPIGRVLRRTHIDELPQLINILRGEMSLIGPRPERPEFVPQLEQAIPRYAERLRVLPGATGLAQVHHGPDTGLPSVRRKLAYDLYYINRLGFGTDLRILLATVFHVFVPYVASKWILRLTDEQCLAELDSKKGSGS
jgi:lipopolysaccharide/colanic/teichoic acid biosynthesis glycosyltransferase